MCNNPVINLELIGVVYRRNGGKTVHCVGIYKLYHNIAVGVESADMLDYLLSSPFAAVYIMSPIPYSTARVVHIVHYFLIGNVNGVDKLFLFIFDRRCFEIYSINNNIDDKK